MKKSRIAEIAKALKEKNNFLIVTHTAPDGDALGTACAIFNLLRENGKKAQLLLPEELPLNYKEFLPETYLKGIRNEGINRSSICVCVDISAKKRIALGTGLTIEDINIPIINIDHHPDNTLFGAMNLVDPEASAAAEILFKITKALPEWEVSALTATLMLLGIVFDTGGFRFDNTPPATLKAAAELISMGAEHHKIMQKLFFSKKLNYLKLNSEIILEHLKTACSNRYAWIPLEEKTLKKYRIGVNQTEGLIDSARMIDKVEIAALIYRKLEGFKISLRSKNPEFSVGEIARKLDGGGHEMAAGGFIKADSMEEAEKILLKLVKKTLTPKNRTA